MKKLIIILVIIFALISIWVVVAQVNPPYRGLGSIPIVVEELRISVLELAHQQRQNITDHLMYVNNLPADHISILLDSGERKAKDEWLLEANGALTDIEARIAALEALAP